MRPSTPNAIVLAQIPGPAFGDGTHPTTRLCAGALDLHCRLYAPETVLDVGTGTGILARIARARGARFIVATDIDPAALEAARSNVALDSHPVDILISSQMPDCWGPRFQLIVANILEEPLRALAPSFYAALAPGGSLLISGFTALQIPCLQTAFQRHGLQMTSHALLEGWAILTFRRA
jgi:ribosomal protein L11 methyltransferase